jgi:hypothetical protein
MWAGAVGRAIGIRGLGYAANFGGDSLKRAGQMALRRRGVGGRVGVPVAGC